MPQLRAISVSLPRFAVLAYIHRDWRADCNPNWIGKAADVQLMALSMMDSRSGQLWPRAVEESRVEVVTREDEIEESLGRENFSSRFHACHPMPCTLWKAGKEPRPRPLNRGHHRKAAVALTSNP
ncbi:hypothetical protein E2C01_037968 [Portunus trituberculatus]|uniref:Uncharacterized protein n=1 Tax=Portunus trituberculatus TaxID=210409 RepID=A0A5B7FG07_PORTR|nr:hypothetical protein [Portunus trituberculatus]